MKTVAEHCRANVLVTPQALFAMEDVTTLHHHGDSVVFVKQLDADLLDIEFYSNSNCLIYIVSGQETITTSDGESYNLLPGSLCLLPQGETLHSDYARTAGSLKAYLVFFGDAVVAEYLKSRRKFAHAKIGPKRLFQMQSSAVISAFFSSLQAMHQQNISSSALLTLKLLELLNLLAAEGKEGILDAQLAKV
ncbi:MAG: AraC family ligand binding domain-containing protein, partial [Kordiimonadaceae bacterium]|nr:AraC family ligand binding domain-containing protein [Kordiimonadaceae bacterium]